MTRFKTVPLASLITDRKAGVMALCLASSLLLVACGGGGSGADDSGSRLNDQLSEDNQSEDTQNGDTDGDDPSSPDNENDTSDGDETPDDDPAPDDDGDTGSGDGEDENDDTADRDSDDSGEEDPFAGQMVEVHGDVDLTWDVPEQRENGDALNNQDIGGYEVRYRREGAEDYEMELVEGGNSDTYRFEEPLEGSYHFTIAVYDTDGLYSEFVTLIPEGHELATQ